MTLATPPRPSASSHPRRQPGPGPAKPEAGTIDPVKLLKRHTFALIAAAVAGAIFGVVAHFVWLQTWPFWTARVLYQCTTPQKELGLGAEVGAGYDEELLRFMATQVAIMTSDRVLSRAAQDPRLLTEAPNWSRQFMQNGVMNTAEAMLELEESINAHVITGTELIELSMTWKNDTDVAGVVGIVNEAYWQDLTFQSRVSKQDEQDAVDRAIREMDADIEQLQEERQSLLRESGVDSLDERVGSIQQRIAEATAQQAEIIIMSEALSTELRALEAELQSAQGTPTFPDTMRNEVEQHPLVMQLKQNIQAMEAQLASLQQQGIGPEHRNYKALLANIDGWNQKLENKREELLMQTFIGRIDLLRQTLRQFDAQELELEQNLARDTAAMNDLLQLEAQIADLENEMGLLAESRGELQGRLTELQSLDNLATASRVQIVESVRVPTQVTFPKIYIMLPLGIILAVGLTAGVIVIAEMVDQRVKGPADIAMIPHTRVIGVIPHASEDPANPKCIETVCADHGQAVIAESYRQLRASIVKTMRRNEYRTLLVVSAMPGSGATSVIANLAHACAAADQRVLVIDANLRRPRQHEVTQTAPAPGLADVLAGTRRLEEVVQQSVQGRFDVITAGDPQHRRYERLATQAMHTIITEAGVEYDIVLIDVAPAVVAGDALELANRVDATCLVTMARAEKRGMIARLRGELDESRGEFLGVIVNGVRSSAGGYFRRNIKATHQYQHTG